jgi:hypothetical protein
MNLKVDISVSWSNWALPFAIGWWRGHGRGGLDIVIGPVLIEITRDRMVSP